MVGRGKGFAPSLCIWSALVRWEAMIGPDYSHETNAQAEGYVRIAGVDEAGRGPLAGPVTAAAVILDPDAIPSHLNDSKKLGVKRREQLCAAIFASAQVYVAHASV